MERKETRNREIKKQRGHLFLYFIDFPSKFVRIDELKILKNKKNFAIMRP
jgi:septin family protein